jgi:hypothetical protein
MPLYARFRKRNLLEPKLDEGFWQGNQGQLRAIKSPVLCGIGRQSLGPGLSSPSDHLDRTSEARLVHRQCGRWTSYLFCVGPASGRFRWRQTCGSDSQPWQYKKVASKIATATSEYRTRHHA